MGQNIIYLMVCNYILLIYYYDVIWIFPLLGLLHACWFGYCPWIAYLLWCCWDIALVGPALCSWYHLKPDYVSSFDFLFRWCVCGLCISFYYPCINTHEINSKGFLKNLILSQGKKIFLFFFLFHFLCQTKWYFSYDKGVGDILWQNTYCLELKSSSSWEYLNIPSNVIAKKKWSWK